MSLIPEQERNTNKRLIRSLELELNTTPYLGITAYLCRNLPWLEVEVGISARIMLKKYASSRAIECERRGAGVSQAAKRLRKRRASVGRDFYGARYVEVGIHPG